MKRLPIGIQDFEQIITNNYLYVDKTHIIYDLISNQTPYFLSRPRRFGKSVLISTFEAIFANKRQLFKGCWIENSSYQWQEYPIIRLDFSAIARINAQELEADLRRIMHTIAQRYNIKLIDAPSNVLVRELIEKLSVINPVVFLVDEYDKPILDAINDAPRALAIQEVLAAFYTSVKAQSRYLRFIFITGIARLARTSVFSGLNNLNDITYRSEYAELVGYSEQDLDVFDAYIQDIAKKKAVSPAVIIDTMREWYDGFRFSYDPIFVYNPFSILRYLESGVLANYWFTSGTPSYLADIIEKHNYTFDGKSIEHLDGASISADADLAYEIQESPLVPLLVQSGYLTIKEYFEERQTFTVTYPNREVQEAFLKLFAERIAALPKGDFNDISYELKQAIAAGNMQEFFAILTAFYAAIPGEIHAKLERYYQSLFYVILKLVRADIIVEKRTNIGRIDAVISTHNRIFIIEFKLDSPACVALEQIKQKKYYESYARSGKSLVLIGISFDTERKNIGEWLVEELTPA